MSTATSAPDTFAETFASDGCALARGLFDAAEVAELEREFDAIVARLLASGENCNARWPSAAKHLDAQDQQVLHTHCVERYSAAWARALFQPRLIAAANAILGPDVVLHHTKLFQKPPGIGAPFPMHQDWGYFPTRSDRMIAAIVHVSPATVDMGCVRAYPGSHREGRIPSASGRLNADDPEAFAAFSQRYPLDGATAFEAEPGDVFFFHYHTVHGSGPNVSDRTRKTVLFQLMPGDDELEEPAGHYCSGMVLNGRSHTMTRGGATRRGAD